MLGQALYLPWWYYRSRICGERRPLQTVLFVTDYCNLRCKHCMADGHACGTMKPYDQIRRELLDAWHEGARFVDFEGGEPTLWRDGDRRLNDLYRLAKQLGFYSGTLTTNGQRDFSDTLADAVWVSVDGYGAYHDAVRGAGTFARLDANIRASGHPALSVAMAVNRLNRPSVRALAEYARENPAIRSAAFNLHTPFPGTEDLTLSWEERCAVLDELIALKREGYPIMNSVPGLRIMKRRGFPKDCWVANYILVDGKRLSQCPGRVFGVCDDCGFCMAGEMYAVLRLKPETLLAGLKLRLPIGRGI